MNELEETAEERLQKKALLNARLLLDKLEKERRSPILMPIVITIVALMGVTIAAVVLKKKPYPEPGKATSQMTPREYASYFGDRVAQRANTTRNVRLEGSPAALQLEVKVDQGGHTEMRVEQSTHSSMTDTTLKAAVHLAEPFGSPPRQPGGEPFAMHVKLTVEKQTLTVEAVPAQP